MVLTGSCPWPGSWSWSYGAHLQLQAREDPNTNGDGGSVHFKTRHGRAAPARPGQPTIKLMSPKFVLRQKARIRRATLTRADFANAIAAFANEIALPMGAIVAGYHPIRDEADPRRLMTALAAKGYRLALPCIDAANFVLVFRSWNMGDPLAPNAWGIAEPFASAAQVIPSLVLVPLLAFDATGHRLGYGGGYYDRAIAALGGLQAIGIAYSGQEVPAVPREPHDRALDAVITEKGLRRFAP